MLAQVDQGTLCDRNASSDLAKIVENVIEEYQQLPSSANVLLSAEIAPELGQVRGDAVTLNMLVGNLVSNAVKYNRPGGTVKVRAWKEETWITLEVSDTGLGIPPAFRPHLFEEFYRVRTPETQNIPGTGLGLVICKRIVEELGGSIEVRSKEGEYTVFTVKLPAAESKKEAEFAEDIGK
jgi:signal transduction histidine kinase